MTEKLKDRSILEPLFQNGWSEIEGRDSITKVFRFASFVDAFGWMTRVAIVAENMNHHPDWENNYRTVTVSLTTHDAGGLSELDVALATKMDELAA